MPNRIMQIPYEGKVYDFHDTDLTTSRLMQFRSWYGEDYGKYLTVIGLLQQFDAAALLCVLWAAKANANEPCDINNLDFAPSDVIEHYSKQAEAEAKKAKAAAAKKTAKASESGPTQQDPPTSD